MEFSIIWIFLSLLSSFLIFSLSFLTSFSQLSSVVSFVSDMAAGDACHCYCINILFHFPFLFHETKTEIQLQNLVAYYWLNPSFPPSLFIPLFASVCLSRYVYLSHSTVCPQSHFGVLKNCGAQTNWASHMRFAADYSETLEVFFCRQQMA
jgi:hypothetical protein